MLPKKLSGLANNKQKKTTDEKIQSRQEAL